MCHGHPRFHSCEHTSLIWYYCPSASIDLNTGYESPCGKVQFSRYQGSNLPCPLRNCQFSDKGGSWMCCKCQQGPNTQGWCSTPITSIEEDSVLLALEEGQRTCDHGCCEDCIKVDQSRSSSPNRILHEARKGGSSSKKSTSKSSSRSSHRCESPFARLSLDKSQEKSSTGTASSLSGSAAYKIELDYRSKKAKQPKNSRKSKTKE